MARPEKAAVEQSVNERGKEDVSNKHGADILAKSNQNPPEHKFFEYARRLLYLQNFQAAQQAHQQDDQQRKIILQSSFLR